MCRFLGSNDVICTVNHNRKGYLCQWKQITQGLFKFKKTSAAVPHAITGMDVSASGGLVGVVSVEGHAFMIDTSNLKVCYRNKKAHMVFGTDVAFSSNSDAFVSVSGDASARISILPQKKSGTGSRLLILLLILLCVLVFIYRDHELVAPVMEQMLHAYKTISVEASSLLARQRSKVL
jgi:hypothetical protein